MGFEFRDNKPGWEVKGPHQYGLCFWPPSKRLLPSVLGLGLEERALLYIHFLHISHWPSSCLYPVALRSWSPKLQWL